MKIGVEFHRVISYDKLFCKCRYYPKEPTTRVFTTLISRSLTENTFLTSDSYCEYEEDQIPGVINKKIVEKAVSLIQNIPDITVFPQILFCRKHIYDGSLASGYQKTACIGIGGVINLSTGNSVKIDKVYLEEDSSSRISNGYSVGRQGIPLIEITTVATELSALELKELLVSLDNALNTYKNIPISSFCRRQDINLSIEGHPRVEIKGVDKLSILPELLLIEEKRQRDAIKEGVVSSSTRSANADGTSTYLRELSGKSRMWPQTQIPVQSTKYIAKTNYLKRLPSQIELLLHNQSLAKLFSRVKVNWCDNDYQILHYLIKNNPKKMRRLFLSYLKGDISEYSIKKGVQDITLPVKELEDIRRTHSSTIEFYKKYKKFFPRGYKPE